MKNLIREAGKKGFISSVIGKSVESKFSKKPFKYLWLCELQLWFRDVHKISVTVFSSSQESWTVKVNTPSVPSPKGNLEQLKWRGEDAISYEEALEAGLLEALKLIKNE